MSNLTDRESKCIYYMKALAIISVVCAHISLIPDDFSKESQLICSILNEMGAIGVGIFFAISGFLFNNNKIRKMKLQQLILSKAKTIGIPWFFSATLVYLYVAIRKGGTLGSYILSIIGYKSSYWYLTVLMALYILFWCVMKSKHENVFTCFFAGLTIVSVILRGLKIIPQNALGVYLNVFNWTIFFAIGFIAKQKKNMLRETARKCTWLLSSWTIGIMVVGLCFILIILEVTEIGHFSYFYIGYVPIELCAIFVLTILCWKQTEKRNLGILLYLGKNSFTIFLYNELLWAGLIVKIGEYFDLWFLLLLRPVIVIVFVCAEMELGKKIFAKLNKDDMFCKLVGMR